MLRWLKNKLPDIVTGFIALPALTLSAIIMLTDAPEENQDPHVIGSGKIERISTLFQISSKLSIDYKTPNQLEQANVRYAQHFHDNIRTNKVRIPESILKATFMVQELDGYKKNSQSLNLTESMLAKATLESRHKDTLNTGAKNFVTVKMSDGRKRTSKALGYAQITRKTGRDYIAKAQETVFAPLFHTNKNVKEMGTLSKKFDAIYTKTFTDSLATTIIYKMHTQDNCNALQRNKLDQNLNSMYAMHMLGLSTGIKFNKVAKRSPNTFIHDIYDYTKKDGTFVDGLDTLAVNANKPTFKRGYDPKDPESGEWRTIRDISKVYANKGMSDKIKVSCHHDEKAWKPNLKLVFHDIVNTKKEKAPQKQKPVQVALLENHVD